VDRRDFVKLASGLLVSPALAASLPAQSAHAASVITRLPASTTRRMAFTIDDGSSSAAIKAYLKFARNHYVKLNFFITSAYSGWRSNEKEIKELLGLGLLQLANHTSTHADLSRLSATSIQKQLMRCHNYIEDAFGVDARPFYRPPFGAYNRTVISAAADIGYTKLMLWNGTLADSSNSTRPFGVRKHARADFKDRKIVLAHANRMLVPDMLPELYELMRDRGLNLIRLNEAY